MTVRDSYTYDHGLLLKDAGAVTADGAGTVASVARVLDLGAGAAEGTMVVDTSALTGGDSTYRVLLQGSNVANMSSGVVELASALVTAAGRSEARFTTRQGGTIYRYVRAFLDVGGTAPSINCVVSLRKD